MRAWAEVVTWSWFWMAWSPGLGCLLPGGVDVTADRLADLVVPMAGEPGQVSGGLAFTPRAGERRGPVGRGRCRGQRFYLVLGGPLGLGSGLHTGAGGFAVGAQ